MSAVIGWSLVHFLWQGALIALLSEAVLAALQNRSAELRYAVRCAALGAMTLAPVITFAVLAAAPQPPLPRDVLVAAVMAGLEPGRGPAWTDAVVIAWSVGASFFAARLLRDWLRVRRLQSSHAGGLLPLDWQVRFDDVAELLRVKAIARLVDSTSLAAPTVIGWMKPVVLVPARVLTGLSQDQVEALLAHELAHVRRHDYLVNLVQSAVEALLFYHPAVWWVSNGIRAEREFCCDDVALRVTHDRLSYARALTTLEEWRGAELQMAMSTLGGPLMQRVQRLVGVRRTSSLVRGPLAAFAAVLVLGCATSAFGHDPATTQDVDQIRQIQAEIERMEARLAELKGELARTMGNQEDTSDQGDARGNVWVERIHADDDGVHVTRDGNHQVFHLRSAGDGLHEVGGDGNHKVYRFEGDGAKGEIVVEVRAGDGSSRPHGGVLRRQGHAGGSGEGEADVVVEVIGEDGEAGVVERRVKIGGVHAGSSVFELREADGEGDVVVDLGHAREGEQLHGGHNLLLRRKHEGADDNDVLALRGKVRATREQADGDRVHVLELHLDALEDLHEHLRHVEGIDLERLHEHLKKALEGTNVEIHGLGDHGGNVRVLKLDDLDLDLDLDLDDLELPGDLELHRAIGIGGGHGAQQGKVRVLRLDGDDGLLEEIRKARTELLLHEHGTNGGKQPKESAGADGEIV